jgi:hypothetical protein
MDALRAGRNAAFGAPSSGSAGPSSASATPTVSPPPTIGLVRASSELTDRLELTLAQVTAGTPIKGTLVVINHGQTAINLNSRCQPKYAVVLTNHKFPPIAAFAADCATLPRLIKPGVNRLPVSVITTYQSCSAASQQAAGANRLPPCIHDSHGGYLPPPMPAGHYEAVLVGHGQLPLPAPTSIPVTLIASTAGWPAPVHIAGRRVACGAAPRGAGGCPPGGTTRI